MTRYDMYGKTSPNGTTPVMLNTKWGVIDKNGNEIVMPIYNIVQILENGYIIVNKSNRWGVLNANGSIVLNIEYDSVTLFDESFFYVSKGTFYGLISLSGKSSTALNYLRIYKFVNGFAKVDGYRGVGLINRDLIEVIPARYSFISDVYNNSVIVCTGSKAFLLGTNGNKIKKLPYSSVQDIGQGLLLAYKSNLWALLDNTFTELLPLQEAIIRPFDGKFAKIIYNNRFGIVNNKGKIIIEPKYISIDMIPLGGFAIMDDSCKTAFFDSNGTRLTPFKYDSIRRQNYYFLDIYTASNVDNKEYKCGILNYEGKEIIPPEYDFVKTLGDGFVVGIKTNNQMLYGICDSKGKLVSQIMYEKVYSIKNRISKTDKSTAKVIHNGCSGYFYW